MTMNQNRRGFLGLSVLAGLALRAQPARAASLEALFAPKPKLWDHWTEHTPTSRVSVDHSVWDQLLHAIVVPGADGINGVRYGKIVAQDKEQLKSYLGALSKVPVKMLNRDEQFAFWVNLYNALTVQVVSDHWPVKSIQDIKLSSGLFSGGPWDKALIQIDGLDVTLNDIEHRILRPIWKDARIHFAVNCASRGCPNLNPSAFQAAELASTLDRLASGYINHRRGWHIDGTKLIASKIFSWYAQDFGADDAQIITYLRAHSEPARAALLTDRTKIDGFEYDWSVNGVDS